MTFYQIIKTHKKLILFEISKIIIDNKLRIAITSLNATKL